MKLKLRILLFIFPTFSMFGQSIQINQVTPTAVAGGINVNVLVTTYNGAGYLSHTYTLVGNTINLSVCYWFNITLPVYQITNNFLIPVPNNINYTVNLSVFNSSSQTVCNNFSVGPSTSVLFLNTNDFKKESNGFNFYPNPSKGIITVKTNDFNVNEISIFDALGRLVSKRNSIDKNTFNLNDLSNGLYLIRFESEIGVINQKIVLEK